MDVDVIGLSPSQILRPISRWRPGRPGCLEFSTFIPVDSHRVFVTDSVPFLSLSCLACDVMTLGVVSQAFEGLDREKKGFLTAEGIKQVVGLDFDGDEVRYILQVTTPFVCLGA